MKLPRWARWLGIGMAVLVVAAGAAVFTALDYFDRERVTGLVAAEVKKLTGRDIHFDGPIGFHILPTLVLRLDGVRLANAAWGTRSDMLKAKRLEVEVSLWPLLKNRQLRIGSVLLDGVELWLETDAKGRGNWVIRGKPKEAQTQPAEPTGEPLAIDLAQGDIRDSTITLRDGKTGHTETLGLTRVSLSDAGSADKLDAQIRLREQALSIKGSTGKLVDLLAGADGLPIDLALTMDGSRIKAKGNIGLAANAGKASLDLDVDIQDGAALSRLANQALPLPLPLLFTGRLEQNGTRSVLPAFKLTVAGQPFSGNASFNASGKRPQLKLVAKADAIDLGALLPPQDKKPPDDAAKPKPKPKRTGRLFNDNPLPLPALPALDAGIDLMVAELLLPGKQTLSAFHATLTLANDRIELQPLAFQLGSGRVNSTAALRLPAGEAPMMALHVESDGITLEELQALRGQKGGLSAGRTELWLDMTTSGASTQQLARSLNGELRLQVGPTRLSGNLRGLGSDLFAKLVETVNPFYKQDNSSNINCVALRLPVTRGAIVVDHSIAVESGKLNIVVAGNIDLGNETIDLTIRPTIKEGLGLGAANLAQLVKLSGSLADPGIGVNLKGAAREGLSIGAAVATGGLSLIGERMLKEKANPHPCVVAMSGAPSERSKAK